MARKILQRKSPAKSSKIYTPKIPDTFLLRGRAKNTVSESTVSNTELSEFFWSSAAKSTHHPHKIDDQRRECKAGGGAYFVFLLGSDHSHTTPPPKKIPLDEEGLLWGWCAVGPLLKIFGPHRVSGGEVSEFLSALSLCAKANSPSSATPSLPLNSVSSLFRNSTLETVFRPFPIMCTPY